MSQPPQQPDDATAAARPDVQGAADLTIGVFAAVAVVLSAGAAHRSRPRRDPTADATGVLAQ